MQERIPGKRVKTTLRDMLAEISQDYVRQRKPVSIQVRVPGIGEVICTKVFRVISSKRIVCLGQADVRRFIIKLYYAKRGAHRSWKRSDRGCRAFIERGISAPGVLFSGQLPLYEIYALVLEYLEDGTRVDRALEAVGNSKERTAILDALMAALARHHASGILQQDLHLGNFLIKDGCIYSLDGDQVTCSRQPIGRMGSLMNLTHLLANLPTSFNPDIDARVMAYASERGWNISEKEVRMIKGEVRRIRRRNLSDYLGKVYRTKDPFLACSESRSFSIYDRRHVDMNFSEILEASRHALHGKEKPHASGYSLVRVGVENMLVWSSKGFGPFILRRLWGASRIWKNALMLNRLGVETPRPIALLGRNKGIFRWECSIFFKPIEGMTLKDLFSSGSISGKNKERVAESIADACSVMNDMGIFIDRINPEEIIVSGDHVIFLGLDAIQKPLFGTRLKQSRLLRRFLSQWQDMPHIKKVLMEQFERRNLV
jgi:tRNA A-37 threonylcarbamoyl transferase component Bud32